MHTRGRGQGGRGGPVGAHMRWGAGGKGGGPVDAHVRQGAGGKGGGGGSHAASLSSSVLLTAVGDSVAKVA
jgi:hypothetical protein